jgi:membrane protein implicated in regulation of membrane protease activity
MRDLPLRIAIMAAALLVASVGVVACGVFLCIALYSAFLQMMAAPWAALVSALLVLLLSVIVVVIGQSISSSIGRRTRREREKRGGLAATIIAEIGRLFGEDAEGFVSGKPILSLAIALIGGFAIGASPKLRALLRTLLRS